MSITNNSKIRIMSALVLFMLTVMVLSMGKKAVMLSIFFLILVVFDEILKYFFKHTRDDIGYWLYMTIIVFFTVTLYQIKSINYDFWLEGVLIIGMIFQLALVIGMFFKLNWEKNYVFLNPFFWTFNLTILFLCFVTLLNQQRWFENFLFFLFISIVADSMAWVTGKKLGKHKLYPEVSPNKTIEGAIGGYLFSAMLIYFYLDYRDINHLYNKEILLCTFLLPPLSILGDLSQSYFKRMVDLKDSSQRIPGHGGFYDRLDSHLFLIPFFVFFTKIILA